MELGEPVAHVAVATLLAVAAVVASRTRTAISLALMAGFAFLIIVLGFELGFLSPEYRED